MATYNVVRATHQTLVANTVDTVNLSDTSQYCVVVMNRSAANTIFFRLDGTDPVLQADDNYLALPNRRTALVVNFPVIQVKLISAGAQMYSIITASAWADLGA